MKTIAMKLAGRCADGCERGQGVKFHALPVGTSEFTHGPALCGQKAGRRSVGWTVREGAEVTCPRCLSRLATLDAQDQRDEDEHNYNTMIGESLRHY